MTTSAISLTSNNSLVLNNSRVASNLTLAATAGIKYKFEGDVICTASTGSTTVLNLEWSTATGTASWVSTCHVQGTTTGQDNSYNVSSSGFGAGSTLIVLNSAPTSKQWVTVRGTFVCPNDSTLTVSAYSSSALTVTLMSGSTLSLTPVN